MKVDKVFVVNILAMIVFVMAFIVGIFETGYQEMGYNLVGIFLMLFGVLGLISQFVVINVSLLFKRKRI